MIWYPPQCSFHIVTVIRYPVNKTQIQMPCAHASYSETGRDRMQIKCDKWMQFLLQPLTLSYGCEKFTSSFKSTLVCSEILSPKQYNDGKVLLFNISHERIQKILPRGPRSLYVCWEGGGCVGPRHIYGKFFV